MLKQLLSLPGFIYDLGGRYYYLGKWICKECTETDAADCAVMYAMCRNAGEDKEACYYFQKIRAYSDLSLEVPYDPEQIRTHMESLLDPLPDASLKKLETQLQAFLEDIKKYS